MEVGASWHNMVRGPTVPRGAGITVSRAETQKKTRMHYKDLEVQQRKSYKELHSTQPHRCLVNRNSGVGGC